MSYAYRVPFIDRGAELKVLEREYGASGFSLVVVYGRRRVGKTRLLREFINQHGGVYYVASELMYPQIVQEFSRAVYDSLGYLPRGRDLVEILEELAGLGSRTVVVIDEFQYVIEAEPSLPSRLQCSIDGVLKGVGSCMCFAALQYRFREEAPWVQGASLRKENRHH